jgi:hypothetical protein
MVACRRELGTFWLWAMARFGQVIFLAAAVTFLIQFPSLSWFLRIWAIAVPFIVLVMFRNIACGSADERGLTFRRYFRTYAISWDEVARVDWSFSRLVLKLEKPLGGSRVAEFILPLTIQEIGAAMTGRWTPEIVVWIMNRLRSFQ